MTAPGHYLLRVAGELDISSGVELVDRAARLVGTAPSAEDTVAGELVLDLADVAMMDASGITALLSIRRLAQRGNATLRLRRVPPRVAKVLDVTGLTPLFPADRLAA